MACTPLHRVLVGGRQVPKDDAFDEVRFEKGLAGVRVPEQWRGNAAGGK